MEAQREQGHDESHTENVEELALALFRCPGGWRRTTLTFRVLPDMDVLQSFPISGLWEERQGKTFTYGEGFSCVCLELSFGNIRWTSNSNYFIYWLCDFRKLPPESNLVSSSG